MTTKSFLIFIFLSSAVNLIHGLSLSDVRGKRELGEPTEEDCTNPPIQGYGRSCCRTPKERIWGDIKSSIHKCLRKYKPGEKPMSAEMGEEEDEGTVTSMDGAKESPGTTLRPIDPPQGHRGHGQRNDGTTYRKPHHHPRHLNDSCFMECIFEDQGFLMNKLVNKLALIERLERNLQKNEQWHKLALAAVEVCSQMGVKIDGNTTCHSGSEQIFRCIMKYLFFNCPNWSQSENCMAIKKFYQKCPNGPPPEMSDSHPAPVTEEMETVSTTESESGSSE